jgi:hypothetical protein
MTDHDAWWLVAAVAVTIGWGLVGLIGLAIARRS